MGHDSYPCPINTSIIDFDGNPKPVAYELSKNMRNPSNRCLVYYNTNLFRKWEKRKAIRFRMSDRFAGFTSFPLQHPDRSLNQLNLSGKWKLTWNAGDRYSNKI